MAKTARASTAPADEQAMVREAMERFPEMESPYEIGRKIGVSEATARRWQKFTGGQTGLAKLHAGNRDALKRFLDGHETNLNTAQKAAAFDVLAAAVATQIRDEVIRSIERSAGVVVVTRGERQAETRRKQSTSETGEKQAPRKRHGKAKSNG